MMSNSPSHERVQTLWKEKKVFSVLSQGWSLIVCTGEDGQEQKDLIRRVLNGVYEVLL